MDNLVLISGLALLAAIMSVVIKKDHPEISLVLGICAGVTILIAIILKVTPVVSEITALVENSGINTSFASIVIKALGICFLTQFVSDSCLDAGEKALSSNVELFGKISIVVISLPLFKQILDVVASLIGV